MKSSAPGSSKLGFVQRVLSRTSSRSRSASKSSATSAEPAAPASADAAGMERPKSSTTPRSSAKFQSELLLLRSQIESLQISVHQMQSDNASKERALADAVREKEQLSVDLKKQRRCNANLRQQLEDERGFYFKEKEQYCHEMNSAKRQRQRLNAAGDAVGSTGALAPPSLSAQKEIAELRTTLNQTLEANYNLSVKFLRMKNTKLGLKQQLSAAHGQHVESAKYCRAKVEEMRAHLDSLVQEHIFKPIPPSSKKYLHLLKANSALMHENLQLQMEVDRLHAEIGRLTLAQVRTEANSKLKLIHHNACAKCQLRVDRDSSRTNTTEKTARSVTSRSSQTTSTAHSRHSHHSHHSQHSQHRQRTPKSSNCRTNSTPSQGASDLSVELVHIEKHGKLTASTVLSLPPQPLSKFDLMTISNSNIPDNSRQCSAEPSNSSLDSNNNAHAQVKSAPDIREILPPTTSRPGPR